MQWWPPTKGGQCDAFTNDRSQLAALGTALENRADHVILAGDHL